MKILGPVKGNTLIFNFLGCDKNYEKGFNKAIKKRFKNTYYFCNGDINKLCLILQKGVYSYENMNSWERLNEISLLIARKRILQQSDNGGHNGWYLQTCRKSMERFLDAKSRSIS